MPESPDPLRETTTAGPCPGPDPAVTNTHAPDLDPAAATHTHAPQPYGPPVSATASDLGVFAARLMALGGKDSAGSTLDVPGSLSPAVAPPGFAIERELGRGGMGVVYLARDSALGRPVALKMVLPEGRSGIVRFLAEAEAVAAIKHPNVVHVYGYGEHAGRPYLALEYLPGGTLAARLRTPGTREDEPQHTGVRLAPVEAAALLGKVASGVAAAHEAGIVHRDLKPGNVLLDAAGEPKVADFGLAKRGTRDLTATQAVMGTPSYMAPEQAGGRAKFVGPQADVWALGVILYECLTGTRPFVADSTQEVLTRVMFAEPVSPRAVVPVVPRDLELVCLKCLAKEPAERYPSAAELADDLGRFTRGEPVTVRAAGPLERLYKWCRRNPAVAGLLAAVLLVFAAGAGIASYFAVEARAREADALKNLTDANDQREAARKSADLAKAREIEANDQKNKVIEAEKRTRRLNQQTVYQAWMNMARVGLRDGNIAQVADALRETLPKPGEDDLRGWEWHYLFRQVFAESRVTPLMPDKMWRTGGPPQPEEGKELVSYLRPLHASPTRLVLMEGNFTSAVVGDTVGSDGKQPDPPQPDVLYDPHVFRVLDPVSGKELLSRPAPAIILPILAREVESGIASFVNDGRRLLIRRGDQIALWDIDAGMEVFRTAVDTAADRLSCAVSEDGSRIAWGPVKGLGDGGGFVVLVAQIGGGQRQELRLPIKQAYTSLFHQLTISADGRWLFAAQTNRWYLWDTTGNGRLVIDQPIAKSPSPPKGGTGIPAPNAPAPKPLAVFDAKGTKLAVYGVENRVEVFDLTMSEPRPPVVLPGRGPIFSPDGTLIVTVAAKEVNYGDNFTVNVYDLTGPNPRAGIIDTGLPAGFTGEYSPQFSPDGKTLLVAQNASAPSRVVYRIGLVPPITAYRISQFAVVGVQKDPGVNPWKKPLPPGKADLPTTPAPETTPPLVFCVTQPQISVGFRPGRNSVIGVAADGVVREWNLPPRDGPGSWQVPAVDHMLTLMPAPHVGVEPPPFELSRHYLPFHSLAIRDARTGQETAKLDLLKNPELWSYQYQTWSANGKRVVAVVRCYLPKMLPSPLLFPTAPGLAAELRFGGSTGPRWRPRVYGEMPSVPADQGVWLNQLVVFDADAGRLIRTIGTGTKEVGFVELDRTGRVALVNSPTACVVIELDTGKELTRFTAVPGQRIAAALSPDGERVALLTEQLGNDDLANLPIPVEVRSLVTGQVVARTTVTPRDIKRPDLPPGTYDGSTTAQQVDDTPQLKFSPDGRWLEVFPNSSVDGKSLTFTVLDTADPALRVVVRRLWTPLLEYTPDGRYMLSQPNDRLPQLTELATGRTADILLASRLLTARFSRDGRRVLAVMSSPQDTYELKVWGVESGQEMMAVPVAPNNPTGFGNSLPTGFGNSLPGGVPNYRGWNASLELPRLEPDHIVLRWSSPSTNGNPWRKEPGGPPPAAAGGVSGPNYLDGTPVPDALARERLGTRKGP